MCHKESAFAEAHTYIITRYRCKTSKIISSCCREHCGAASTTKPRIILQQQCVHKDITHIHLSERTSNMWCLLGSTLQQLVGKKTRREKWRKSQHWCVYINPQQASWNPKLSGTKSFKWQRYVQPHLGKFGISWEGEGEGTRGSRAECPGASQSNRGRYENARRNTTNETIRDG